MNTEITVDQLSVIESEMNMICLFIKEELEDKKKLIKQKDRQMEELKLVSERQREALSFLESRCRENEAEADGNRQLINKLLGDISKLQSDIGWYRRTYEERSFLGTIKEKIKRKL